MMGIRNRRLQLSQIKHASDMMYFQCVLELEDGTSLFDICMDDYLNESCNKDIPIECCYLELSGAYGKMLNQLMNGELYHPLISRGEMHRLSMQLRESIEEHGRRWDELSILHPIPPGGDIVYIKLGASEDE